MQFAKEFFIFLFFCLVYSPNSSAFSLKTEWSEESYKITQQKTPFVKRLPFSLRTQKKKRPGSDFLKYFGGVVSPIVGGDDLHAVDVIASNDKKFVFSAYNFRGEPKKGALQLLEVESNHISLSSEITFTDSDINAIYLDQKKLYFAGSDAKGSFFSHAIIRKNQFVGLASKVYLSGYVATDIAKDRDSIYITTANNGGVYSFYLGLDSPDWFVNFFDTRSLFVSEEPFVYVLSGQPGRILRLNKSGQILGLIELGGALTPESKSFLLKSEQYLYATVGEGGLKVLCDDQVVGELPSVTLPDFDPSKTVTNALAVSNQYLFTASGEGGLYMYKKVKALQTSSRACHTLAFNELDHFNFWPEVSANHVAIQNNYAFVASGAYGVQAFKIK